MEAALKGEETERVDNGPSLETQHIDKLVWILPSQCNLQQPLIFLSLYDSCLTPGEDLTTS